MKKNILIKAMGMAIACALVVGNNGMVAHAYVGDDGLVRDDVAAGGLGDEPAISIGGDSGSSSSGGSSSDSGSSGSSSSGGSSSNSSSSDSGNYSYDGGSGNSGSSNSSASYSAPAPKAAGSTTSVTGKETFRALAKSGSGTYKVTHKGVEIATFTLMDADKKAVPCTAVALKQREDGKWAINFQVTEKYAETTKDADTTGLTVGAPLDRTYMYNTLGVSYVTINDTVVIDIEAEAQAAATK